MCFLISHFNPIILVESIEQQHILHIKSLLDFINKAQLRDVILFYIIKISLI